MIDIHAHILPGLDDGLQTIEESVQLAFEFQKAGFTTVIATPHIKDGQYDHEREAVAAAVDALNTELACAGIALDIFAGAEYAMDIRVLKDLEQGRLMTLGCSRHVLLEFPCYSVPTYAQTIVSVLIKNGFTPVLAHPERCHDIGARDPSLIRWYVDKGCLVQVDAQSLAGANGRAAMKTAWLFIRDQVAGIISLDAHRVISVRRTFQSLEKLFTDAEGRTLRDYFDKTDLFLGHAGMALPQQGSGNK
ncbi:MAG: CpsB/CapC family capsule biosynthesis tyrosine phosphatase [Planctomycetota bacterium]